MKYMIATALAVAYARVAFGMTINTPMNVVACQPVLLSWTDGTAPYYPSIIPGGQPSAPAIKSFDTTSSTSLTWKVDIAPGTSITVALKDSTGATAYTDTINIQSSSDQSCLNGSATTAASGASAPPAPSPVGATPATSARVSGTQQAAASSSGSAKPSSGAVRTSVTYGLTGVLAAIGVALF
ncbi:hypothetical protein P691DRAFT_476758 [Macrolepiota fuliginosa MF-IS2]|uniref:Ser-Thr-rich glycosyl-phosphatidyl-inositol-anchored membrane family-domain-containing protein n=1 Tax=Macrolepiota fuliginosa MF-IS2 TaxID=1400762 RepID=A0A9P5XJJ2_9AGAR|nr:hypothetical protein P691DRAFT_476758 [Macrolepiota fuliginosa MF-IS2]